MFSLAQERYDIRAKRNEQLRIFDLGSGPDLPAIKALKAHFEQKQINPREKFFIIGSDVDGTSLYRMIASNCVNEAWHVDLNYMNLWEKKRKNQSDNIDSFDLVTARLVLH